MKKYLHFTFVWWCVVVLSMLFTGCGTTVSAGKPVPTPAIVTEAVHDACAGDWSSLRAKMTPDMAALVTPASASQVTAWFDQLGQVQSISTTLVSSAFGMDSYAFTIHFAKGDVGGTLDEDASGKIAGFTFKTPDHDQYVTKGDVWLPFRGEWFALWGGIDPETNTPHAKAGGSERYAYDLLVEKNGTTHAGSGSRNTDYYCYGEPILSPVAGKVVTVVDGIPQNKPGQMNALFFPGNCVEIDDGFGEYIVLAHLQPYRMAVKVGETVRLGQLIGYCGNSGNSSEPHVHMQMQDGPDMSTSEGLPITFHHFLQNGKPVAGGVALGKVSLQNQGTF